MTAPVTRDMTDIQIAAVLRAQGRSADYIKSYLRGWRQVQ